MQVLGRPTLQALVGCSCHGSACGTISEGLRRLLCSETSFRAALHDLGGGYRPVRPCGSGLRVCFVTVAEAQSVPWSPTGSDRLAQIWIRASFRCRLSPGFNQGLLVTPRRVFFYAARGVARSEPTEEGGQLKEGGPCGLLRPMCASVCVWGGKEVKGGPYGLLHPGSNSVPLSLGPLPGPLAQERSREPFPGQNT